MLISTACDKYVNVIINRAIADAAATSNTTATTTTTATTSMKVKEEQDSPAVTTACAIAQNDKKKSENVIEVAATQSNVVTNNEKSLKKPNLRSSAKRKAEVQSLTTDQCNFVAVSSNVAVKQEKVSIMEETPKNLNLRSAAKRKAIEQSPICMCMLCDEKPATFAFKPCGHRPICSSCSKYDVLYAMVKHCPTCGTEGNRDYLKM